MPRHDELDRRLRNLEAERLRPVPQAPERVHHIDAEEWLAAARILYRRQDADAGDRLAHLAACQDDNTLDQYVPVDNGCGRPVDSRGPVDSAGQVSTVERTYDQQATRRRIKASDGTSTQRGRR